MAYEDKMDMAKLERVPIVKEHCVFPMTEKPIHSREI